MWEASESCCSLRGVLANLAQLPKEGILCSHFTNQFHVDLILKLTCQAERKSGCVPGIALYVIT